ncbi:MAG: M48 family metalloprotease [Candidatus Omnitrophica bacterium]|nr:M48 family metalloprotease [Candidatus Omnitrophota bacterium]
MKDKIFPLFSLKEKCNLLCLVFLSFSLVGCAALGTYNPATGRREFIVIPTEEEVSMGRSIHNSVIGQDPISHDKAQTARIERIGRRLALVSDRQDYKYNFYLIEKDVINAFTTPGGNIYIYSGLVDKLQSDDEVAAVLAHEIGHCAARHTIKRFQAAVGFNIIGGLLLKHTEMKDSTRSIAALSSNAVMQLVVSAYSRKDEYQADKLGIKYLDLAGYEIEGMLKILQFLDKESRGPKIPLILRTHPYVPDRIVAVKEKIAGMRGVAQEF